MTERITASVNQEPQIEVLTKNDEGIFILEGLIKKQDTYLAIAPVPQGVNITDLIKRVNGRYPAEARNFYGERLLISHSENFVLHDTLLPSQSAEFGSQTEYAGQTANKEAAIQVLRKFMISKPPHGHDGPEFYYHISGELAVRKLNLSNRERSEEILSSQKPLVVVPRGYIHQVKAVEDVAISVLVCSFIKHEYHPELNLFG